MKISTRNILRALRLYAVADDSTSVRDIRKLEVDDQESFLRAQFVLGGQRYGLLFGSAVDEDLVDEMWPNRPLEATPITNPLDNSTAAIPFQGKSLLLFDMPSGKKRLDVYLASEFDQSLSRNLWQKYIKAGCVKINGEICLSPKTEVSDVDDITVNFPKKQNNQQKIPIIYQDEDVIVINKPSGILTHAKGGINDEQTVADFFEPLTSFAKNTNRAGIVHRLDRETSGLMIGARNEAAAKFLQKQFAERKVKKTYLAVVEKTPKLAKALIDLPIARHPQKPSTFRVDANGKSAETTYRVLATNKQGRSLVLLQPKTGRTHQLRVHLAHIGSPIVGDRIYGTAANRLLLHAYKLELTLPSGNHQIFEATLPDEFLSGFPKVDI